MVNFMEPFYNILCVIAPVFLLVACSGDDNADVAIVESREPITFTVAREPFSASVPLTRVVDTENASSVSSSWTNGDNICVSVSSRLTGSRQTTVCTLNANGMVDRYLPQLYWQKTGSYNISAWYSNIGDSPTTNTAVDLADQTGGELPCVLRAEPLVWTYIGKRADSIPISFKHQLAKVMVRLVDAGGNAVSTENVSVWIRNCYTSCTVDDGTVIPTGKADGYVKMMPPKDAGGCYQANVIPDTLGTMRQIYALEIKAGNKTTGINLDAPVCFEIGKIYWLTVTVK